MLVTVNHALRREQVTKMSAQTVVVIFVAVSILAGGAGYARLMFKDATIRAQNDATILVSSTRMAAELANLQTEKSVVLDMMKERDEELSMFKTESEKCKKCKKCNSKKCKKCKRCKKPDGAKVHRPPAEAARGTIIETRRTKRAQGVLLGLEVDGAQR